MGTKSTKRATVREGVWQRAVINESCVALHPKKHRERGVGSRSLGHHPPLNLFLFATGTTPLVIKT